MLVERSVGEMVLPTLRDGGMSPDQIENLHDRKTAGAKDYAYGLADEIRKGLERESLQPEAKD